MFQAALLHHLLFEFIIAYNTLTSSWLTTSFDSRHIHAYNVSVFYEGVYGFTEGGNAVAFPNTTSNS